MYTGDPRTFFQYDVSRDNENNRILLCSQKTHGSKDYE